MKIKFSILIFVFGYALDFMGIWLKIIHQPLADIILAIAALLKIIGLLLFTFFLLGHPKVKEFLAYDEFRDSFKN